MLNQRLVDIKMNDELERAIERSMTRSAAPKRASRLGGLRKQVGRYLIGAGERIQGSTMDRSTMISPAN
jgi:hypothetical protein